MNVFGIAIVFEPEAKQLGEDCHAQPKLGLIDPPNLCECLGKLWTHDEEPMLIGDACRLAELDQQTQAFWH